VATVPVVSVIVPVRDGAHLLEECLDGIGAQEGAPPTEVIVVDNCSRDATARLAADHTAVDRVVEASQPGSYSARNAGIAVAKGEILAFTDADCRPEPAWLAAGVEGLGDRADLVGGAVVAVASPSPTVWERYDRALYLRQAEHVALEGFAATANLFVTARVVQAVGPFDASLLSGGDSELCRRAGRAGFRLVHAPDARVGHLPRSTALDTWRLHRRLGGGFAVLARRGERSSAWHDPAMRTPLGAVVDAVAADGVPLRRRRLLLPHLVATGGRWTGWVMERSRPRRREDQDGNIGRF
jgi:glycosyltransferase involved in cell wall biosynthesis